MLLNASIPACEPERVAGVLAEIVHGRVVPFPAATGSFVVVAADGQGSGTHLEVHPTAGSDTGGEPGVVGNGLAHAGGVAIGVPCGRRQLQRIARRAGWRSRTSLREGAYHVAELWIENRFLLEALTPEMQAEYRSFLAGPTRLWPAEPRDGGVAQIGVHLDAVLSGAPAARVQRPALADRAPPEARAPPGAADHRAALDGPALILARLSLGDFQAAPWVRWLDPAWNDGLGCALERTVAGEDRLRQEAAVGQATATRGAGPPGARATLAALPREPLRYGVCSLLAVAAAAVFLFPIFWSLSTSLRSPLDTFTVTGLGIPWLDFTPTLRNWLDELRLPSAILALRNSALIAVCATLLALLLGTPAAYALARFRFRAVPNGQLALWFFSQRLLPPVALIIPFYLMMRAVGLLDTRTGIILLDATALLPFVVVVLRQTFLDLPVAIEEAALIDGAGHWAAFWRIALPLAAPAIAATGLIVFAGAWNDFIFALTLFSQRALTMPIRISESIDTRGVLFWVLGTRAMLAMLPPLLVALLAQRYIVRGLTLGSVTG